MCDAEAAAEAARAGVGKTITLRVGHRRSHDGEPLTVTGIVRMISDGNYVLSGPGANGMPPAGMGGPGLAGSPMEAWLWQRMQQQEDKIERLLERLARPVQQSSSDAALSMMTNLAPLLRGPSIAELLPLLTNAQKSTAPLTEQLEVLTKLRSLVNAETGGAAADGIGAAPAETPWAAIVKTAIENPDGSGALIDRLLLGMKGLASAVKPAAPAAGDQPRRHVLNAAPRSTPQLPEKRNVPRPPLPAGPRPGPGMNQQPPAPGTAPAPGPAAAAPVPAPDASPLGLTPEIENQLGIFLSMSCAAPHRDARTIADTIFQFVDEEQASGLLMCRPGSLTERVVQRFEALTVHATFLFAVERQLRVLIQEELAGGDDIEGDEDHDVDDQPEGDGYEPAPAPPTPVAATETQAGATTTPTAPSQPADAPAPAPPVAPKARTPKKGGKKA